MLTGRRFAETAVMSVPCRRTRPVSGVSNPAIIRRLVVLPQPDGPSIEKNSPSRISRVTRSTAVWLPNRLLTPSSAIAKRPFSVMSKSNLVGLTGAMDRLIEQSHPSLGLALDLIAAVRAEAEARSFQLAVGVVNAAGHVIASQRMDGAALGAMQLAVGKAYTAVLWGTRSGYFMETTQPGGDDWGFNVTDPRVVVYAGGVPLFVDGALVGGLGASGGTAEQDEECVTAAAAAVGFAVA